MGKLTGREIDWFRDISRTDEDGRKWGRLYVRFRLNGNSRSDQLIMLRNAYPEGAPKLLYPNAVVVTEGAFVGIDIAVRGERSDVGCGFSLRPGVFSGRSDKETRPIADKLYAVGPPSQGPDGAGTWRVDHVGRYQGDPNLIRFESLASLETGNRITEMRATLIPRSRCDIYAWPVKAYNDLDEGEAYSEGYPPPGTGNPPFGSSKDARPMPLSQIDTSSSFTSSRPPTVESPGHEFKRIEIQSEKAGADDRLGFLSVQFFVFDGSNGPPAGARGQPISLQAKLAAACPRGNVG
ncbi:MAG TPA: hypothetical protein VJ756_07705 [Terriglobales bacterium]|nr:hypothetical protein [Terriglobales bacterium]